jgi:hypothetical protein
MMDLMGTDNADSEQFAREFEQLTREDEVVGRYISTRLDSDRFRFKPWQDDLLTKEQLHQQVAQSIERDGRWQTYAELRMDSGPTVTVEPAGSGYQVTAECGITVGGRYHTLDEALAAGSLFAALVWDMVMNGATKGFISPKDKRLASSDVRTQPPPDPPQDAPFELKRAWPLVVRWGASNDVDRGALIDGSSTQELEALANTVESLLPAINAYLDQTGNAEYAVPYGDLAQAGVEARIQLNRRS